MEAKPSYKMRGPESSFRPTLMGREFAISCGHYLAAAVAARILHRGGNAIDAGVAASMALAVLQPDIVSVAGVAPTLIYSARERRVTGLAGLGYWPRSTSVDRLIAEGGESIPEGVLRSVVPAAPATHIEALRRFGTISFAEAAAPAAELASKGFAMYAKLAHSIAADAQSYARWPSSAGVFLPGGAPPKAGALFKQEDLGRTLGGMIAASEGAGTREAGLTAAADYFYRGPVAHAIADYHRRVGGFMTKDDLADFVVPVETTHTVDYHGYEIHSNGAWCQGILLLQVLNSLKTSRPSQQSHNSAAYLHRIIEALDLAFADREAYLGDPDFVPVPVAGLLSEEYARSQFARIGDRGFGRMPAPGKPAGSEQLSTRHLDRWLKVSDPPSRTVAADTIHCSIMDGYGNVYCATLSDNTHDTPLVPGTGLAISSRGSQSRLQSGHPSEVKPLKRPRLTPAPIMVLRGGEPFLSFGTPGGDVQMQALLQVFFNFVEFGMPLQMAIEQPRVWSVNFPNSFAPHDYRCGGLCVEEGIAETVLGDLGDRGHVIDRWGRFPAAGGAVCAVHKDQATGLVHAGADPRRESYAYAW